MIFKDYIEIKKEDKIYKTDLLIVKTMYELIEVISMFNGSIASKILQNEFLEKDDCMFLEGYFGVNFLEFIIENIENENLLFKDVFGVIFILVIKTNNKVIKNLCFISEDENIDFDQKIAFLIEKANEEL